MASQRGTGARRTLAPLMFRIMAVAYLDLDGRLGASQQPQGGASRKGKEAPPAATRKGKEAPPDVYRKGKVAPPAATGKGKGKSPAADRKGKEPAPSDRKDRRHGTGTHSEHSPQTMVVQLSEAAKEGLEPSPTTGSNATSTTTSTTNSTTASSSSPSGQPSEAAEEELEPPPPLAALPPAPLPAPLPAAEAAFGSHLRLQVKGWSLPPPLPAPPLPPLSSRHRRRAVCSPASMGCCAGWAPANPVRLTPRQETVGVILTLAVKGLYRRSELRHTTAAAAVNRHGHSDHQL
ncbi:hypothetical protein NDU88_004978 [Pleurodeles waltl]|uniref:Uncharacterized protein n=1 Tax=Pleurodeles waltl TaxID=8319 RepID=A0AAV7M9W8_PLEWA|nr:hypothetical protein NDU88_004978 [Pleurodeles waltl]